MTEQIYFFDSYALLATLRADPAYRKYMNSTPVMTKLDMFEVFCGVARHESVRTASALTELFSGCVVEYDTDVVMEAGKMHVAQVEKGLSMTDCVGYVVAKRLGLKFLTGDKKFRGMKNVEFVK